MVRKYRLVNSSDMRNVRRGRLFRVHALTLIFHPPSDLPLTEARSNRPRWTYYLLTLITYM
jgi:hypothetical protein